MLMKTFLSQSADRALGLLPQTADDLYRYVQAGMADRPDGFRRVRAGPGGGAPATPFACAFMVVAALGAAGKVRAHDNAWNAWHLKPEHQQDDDFGDVLQRILENPQRAAKVERVEVFHTGAEARIYWLTSAGEPCGKVERFWDRDGTAEDREHDGAFRKLATIGGKTLHQIALDLAAAAQPAEQSS